MRSSQLAPGVDEVRLVNEQFILDSNRPMKLIKIEMRSGGDALVLASGGGGTPQNPCVIERIEIDTWTEDGVKGQNASADAASHIRINGGYVWCHARSAGAHQDGFQIMGGSDIIVSNVLVRGADTQGIFVNKAGSGATTPTDIVFDGCKVGCPNASGGPATPVNVNSCIRSGVRNCEVWTSPRYGRSINVSGGNINQGNEIRSTNYPGCETEPDGSTPPEPPAVPATGATAGSPGRFTPSGSEAPEDFDALEGVVPDPITAWLPGEYVTLGDDSDAYWGAADHWQEGRAPSPPPDPTEGIEEALAELARALTALDEASEALAEVADALATAKDAILNAIAALGG